MSGVNQEGLSRGKKDNRPGLRFGDIACDLLQCGIYRASEPGSRHPVRPMKARAPTVRGPR